MNSNARKYLGWPWKMALSNVIEERRRVISRLYDLWDLTYSQMIGLIGSELQSRAYEVELRQLPQQKGAMFIARNALGMTIVRYIHDPQSKWMSSKSTAYLTELMESEQADDVLLVMRSVYIDDLEDGLGMNGAIRIADGFDLVDLLEASPMSVVDTSYSCPLCGEERQLKRNYARSECFSWVCPNTHKRRCTLQPVWVNLPGPRGEFTLPS